MVMGKLSAARLAELLEEHGVDWDAPKRRQELAYELAGKGFEEAWLGLLWTQAREGRRPHVLLTGWLHRPWDELVVMVRSLEAYQVGCERRGERKAAAKDQIPSHYDKSTTATFEQQAKANGQTLDEYLVERDERHAFALVAHERRLMREAAREMGWPEDRVCEVLRRLAPGAGFDAEWLIHRTTRQPISPERQKELQREGQAQVRAERQERASRREVAAIDNTVTSESVEALRKRDEATVARLDRQCVVQHRQALEAAGLLSLPQPKPSSNPRKP
ncbi:MAG: hypothetical protein IT458_08410 [Planctomycetes bacterium]|nr:hypothetical protein [Planctomycetota bacterium]